jgi:hypothetical protein
MHIANAFEEYERKNVFLISAGVNTAAQKFRRIPKLRLQFF